VNPVESGERKIIPLGHVSGFHGVSGWVKIYSLTEPREAIFDYQPWLLGEAFQATRIVQGKKQGKYLIALLENVGSREEAEALLNQSIAVYRDQFPELPDTEYYWADLIGSTVSLLDGTEVGEIRSMLATGANDVMVVQGEKEHLIPFVLGPYVTEVDLKAGRVVVNWDPEF
jgi:16S rRNA processing protein RimM